MKQKIYGEIQTRIDNIRDLENVINVGSGRISVMMEGMPQHGLGPSKAATNVRPEALQQFLRAEIVELEKQLKVLETKLKGLL